MPRRAGPGRPKGSKNRTVEEKQSSMRERISSRIIEIPQIYLTPESRIERLEVVRKRLGLTNTEYAAKLGISKQYYTNFKSGAKNPTMGAVKLAEQLMRSFYVRQWRSRKTEEARIDALKAANPEIAFDMTV